MKTDLLLALVLIVCLTGAVGLSRDLNQHRRDESNASREEQLYLSGRNARRMSLAFNGLAADWYWMRSLQYVGGKVVEYEDAHNGQFGLTDLAALDLRLLPSLLDVTTTLDPQFIPAYEYGAVILPEINPDAAIALLNKGIAANPSSWRLHQDLGYIYWQRKDYARASQVYEAGAKLPDAPAWVTAMAARMKAAGGSPEAAREMYQRLYESSDDERVRQMVVAQLMRMQWLEDREEIRHALEYFQSHSRDGRCPPSWRGIFDEFPSGRFRFDRSSGAPLDPSGVPYRLTNGGCDVDLDPNSKVPR
jgi:tetratricopeptide (TPR) repeat protein